MMSNIQESGIYPDLLHIMDLQLCHDVISSCLLDMSDTSSPRERKLQQLLADYEVWCSEQRHMAHFREALKIVVSINFVVLKCWCWTPCMDMHIAHHLILFECYEPYMRNF